ncbi:MAG: flagellar biosynthesis protein FlhB [Syntrophorhabdaceae bacterium]|nr:flagellar biosynthesis protein FlhB [Syntrophorhabdaceae bacterium]
MADTFQEKTEQPTEKRLEDAKKKGQIAQSRELSSCILILFSSLFLYFTLSKGFEELFKVYTGYVRNVNLDVNLLNINHILSVGAIKWLWLVVPVFALFMAVSFFGTFVQTGFVWSTEALKINLETINPLAGIKKLFSKRSAVETLKSIAKIIVLSYICYSIITNELPTLISLSGNELQDTISYIGRISFKLAIKVSVVLIFIAGLDLLFQKWQHKKDLMMTHQEIKEEIKEREGNPLVKSRIRSLQREMARHRMIEDVKKADLVITNPTTFAIAIMYTPSKMHAPKIVAKGAGFVAEKIKRMALIHNVPIKENKPLARALFYSVKVGQYLPEEFYMVVAELLAQVYKQKKRILE